MRKVASKVHEWRCAACALLAAWLLSLCCSLPVWAADEPVDVELVLAVDISYSMDLDELALQREGYSQAVVSAEFLDALRLGPTGRIAVAYVEWAGVDEQKIVVDWMILEDETSAQRFAQAIRAAPLRRVYRTSISGAIAFSANLFELNGFHGLRRVIDISGDGTNNQGPLVESARDNAVARGITINGLPLLLKDPAAAMLDIGDLDVYYEDCVIGGPGAFVVPVRSPHEFADAIRTKLVLEVARLQPRTAPILQQVQARHRISCTVGERMWMERWGN